MVSVRITYHETSMILILEYGRLTHEIAACIYHSANPGDEKYWPGGEAEGVLRERGNLPYLNSLANPDCKLEDGTWKQPDYAVQDKSPGLDPTLVNYPTLVWEVARTQSSSNLAEAAARWIAASLCRVQLVIAIDIILGTKKLRMDLTPSTLRIVQEEGEGAGAEEDTNAVGSSQKIEASPKWVSQSVLSQIKEKGIKEIWCQLWEQAEVEELKTLPEEHMNVLVRNDGLEKVEKRKGVGEPGKKFYCIQQAGSLILKCHAHASRTFKVGWLT